MKAISIVGRCLRGGVRTLYAPLIRWNDPLWALF